MFLLVITVLAYNLKIIIYNLNRIFNFYYFIPAYINFKYTKVHQFKGLLNTLAV